VRWRLPAAASSTADARWGGSARTCVPGRSGARRVPAHRPPGAGWRLRAAPFARRRAFRRSLPRTAGLRRRWSLAVRHDGLRRLPYGPLGADRAQGRIVGAADAAHRPQLFRIDLAVARQAVADVEYQHFADEEFRACLPVGRDTVETAFQADG